MLGLHGDKYGASDHLTPRPSLCSLGRLRALGQPLGIQFAMRLNSLLPWRQTARVLSAGLSGNPALRREGYLEFWASADPRFGLQLQKSRLNFLLSDHPGPRVLEGETPLNTSQLWFTDTRARDELAAPGEQDTAISEIKGRSQRSKRSHSLGDHVQIEGKRQSKHWERLLCFRQD